MRRGPVSVQHMARDKEVEQAGTVLGGFLVSGADEFLVGFAFLDRLALPAANLHMNLRAAFSLVTHEVTHKTLLSRSGNDLIIRHKI